MRAGGQVADAQGDRPAPAILAQGPPSWPWNNSTDRPHDRATSSNGSASNPARTSTSTAASLARQPRVSTGDFWRES
jgi:hypothetical protein